MVLVVSRDLVSREGAVCLGGPGPPQPSPARRIRTHPAAPGNCPPEPPPATACLCLLIGDVQGEDVKGMGSERCRQVAEQLGMPYQAVRGCMAACLAAWLFSVHGCLHACVPACLPGWLSGCMPGCLADCFRCTAGCVGGFRLAARLVVGRLVVLTAAMAWHALPGCPTLHLQSLAEGWCPSRLFRPPLPPQVLTFVQEHSRRPSQRLGALAHSRGRRSAGDPAVDVATLIGGRQAAA